MNDAIELLPVPDYVADFERLRIEIDRQIAEAFTIRRFPPLAAGPLLEHPIDTYLRQLAELVFERIFSQLDGSDGSTKELSDRTKSDAV